MRILPRSLRPSSYAPARVHACVSDAARVYARVSDAARVHARVFYGYDVAMCDCACVYVKSRGGGRAQGREGGVV